MPPVFYSLALPMFHLCVGHRHGRDKAREDLSEAQSLTMQALTLPCPVFVAGVACGLALAWGALWAASGGGSYIWALLLSP